jgi:hypothetical protein
MLTNGNPKPTHIHSSALCQQPAASLEHCSTHVTATLVKADARWLSVTRTWG